MSKFEWFIFQICIKLFNNQNNQAQGPVLSVIYKVHSDANNSGNLDATESRNLKSIWSELILL